MPLRAHLLGAIISITVVCACGKLESESFRITNLDSSTMIIGKAAVYFDLLVLSTPCRVMHKCGEETHVSKLSEHEKCTTSELRQSDRC